MQTLTVQINKTSDKRAFGERLNRIKELGATWDKDTKSWTITLDRNVKLAVLREWVWTEGLDDADVVRCYLGNPTKGRDGIQAYEANYTEVAK